MKYTTALLLAAFCAASPALAQSTAPATTSKPAQQAAGTAAPAEKLDPAKEQAIRHLLDLTEISKMGENISQAISRQVQEAVGRGLAEDQVPKFMETFNSKFTSAAPPAKVTDAIVPIYAKHFTMEDIQGLVKFYESPLGTKLVKEMPQVVQDSQAAGVQINQDAAITVLRGMQPDYPFLKQMLPPDPNAPAPTPGASTTPAPTPTPANPPVKAQPGQPATPSTPKQ
jgi:uncharacterized protein